MDIIRKKISIDRGISHTPGLMPYYPYNDENVDIKFVNGLDVDGNYENYVCDFGKVSSCVCGITPNVSYYKEEICTSGVSVNDNSVEARFRYCDAIHNYLVISEALRNGVFGKVVKHTETSVIKTDCSMSDHDCDEEVIEVTAAEDFYDVVTILHESKSKFEFIPLDIDLFSKIDTNIYRLTYPEIDVKEVLVADEPVSFDANMQIKRHEAVNKLVEGNFIVLLYNFDEVIGYEDEWRLWWEKWFGTGWETTAYGPTYTPQTAITYFPFCQNFEKYLLGKFYVPDEFAGSAITGVYVPEYIYYADLHDYIKWFEDRNIPKDKILQKEWDKHGGDVFFAYLNTLSGNWISANTEHDFSIQGEQTRFKFLAPYTSVPVALTQTHDITWNYESYIDSSTPFSAVGAFSAYSIFSASNFVTLTDSGYVESKLSYVSDKNATTVEGIFGVWEEANVSNPTNSSILAGTYYTGTSTTIGVSVVQKTYHSGGTVEIKVLEGQSAQEEAPTVHPTSSMVLLVDKYLDSNDPDNSQTSTQITSGPEITGDIVLIEYITATTKYNYSWWEFEETNENVLCGDGEVIQPNELKYQTIQTISNVKNIIKNPQCFDLYYFYTQYQNGVSCAGDPNFKVDYNSVVKRFTLPYKSNTFFDMEYITTDGVGDLYTGNYIPKSGVTIESGMCTIHYVIGGRAYYDEQTSGFTEVPKTGIHYLETYPYVLGYKLITLDGKKDTDFYYETLNYGSNDEIVTHEEYKKTRLARKAKLIGMEVATTWTSENAIMAPIFTDEFSSLQQYDNKNVLDISVDRGIAAAFETNYKLGECNTLDDLENYSNNFFNI